MQIFESQYYYIAKLDYGAMQRFRRDRRFQARYINGILTVCESARRKYKALGQCTGLASFDRYYQPRALYFSVQNHKQSVSPLMQLIIDSKLHFKFLFSIFHDKLVYGCNNKYIKELFFLVWSNIDDIALKLLLIVTTSSGKILFACNPGGDLYVVNMFKFNII